MKWRYGRRKRGGGRPFSPIALVLVVLVVVAAGYALAQAGAISRPLKAVSALLVGRSGSTPADKPDLKENDLEYTESRFLMDTFVSIRADGPGSREAVQAAFEEIQRIESLTSRFVEGSDVSRINRAAGGDPVSVSSETIALLERARAGSDMSGGAFDVTVGPVVDAWGFGTDAPHVPDESALAEAVSLVDSRALEVDAETAAARLSVRGMSVDLGGIAKGYAADRAGEVLRERGIEHALIDAGGNIVAVGTRRDGKPWRVGIRDPRGKSPADTIGPVIEVQDGAVVTSGDYERFFVSDGVRYHHILDPATGRPADRVRSATVIARNSCEADMLSTAVFVLGVADGLAMVEGLDGVHAVVVGADGELVFSEGFPGR